jgi:hypothetical protein
VSSSRRHAGWFDLSFNPTTVVGLLLWLVALAASSQLPEEVLFKPRVESPEDSVFLAPFVNVSFLRSLEDLLAEIQLMQERSTGIYLDPKTHLIWTARDNGRDIDWRRANDYCSQLELAGFDNWRLPILGELEDIMDPLASGGYSTPSPINLTACCVWSSTRKDDVGAWNFNYRYSKRFSGSLTHTFDLRALCVRAWSAEDGWIPGEEETAAGATQSER